MKKLSKAQRITQNTEAFKLRCPNLYKAMSTVVTRKAIADVDVIEAKEAFKALSIDDKGNRHYDANYTAQSRSEAWGNGWDID